MSCYDGFTPAYTYRLSIEREDRTIIETAITAKAEPGEIAKAKKDLKRLIDAYSPTFPAPPAPAPDIPTPPEVEHPCQTEPDAPATPAEYIRIREAAAQVEKVPETGTLVKPFYTTLPEAAAPPQNATRDRPEGTRGLLWLCCPECGNTFGTFLREYQTEVPCKCGHQIDLAAQLGRFAYTCPYCEQTRWGKTNLEDPEITIRCKCGGDITVRWDRDTREYKN